MYAVARLWLLLWFAATIPAWAGPPYAPEASPFGLSVSRSAADHARARHGFTAPPRPITRADPGSFCETAIVTAEYMHALPSRLLGAIGLTETGRPDPTSGRFRPWPWTINAEGEGQFFSSAAAAVAAVKALQARGVRSIDVGCMQVNLMYHPNAFGSLEQAFDPRSNADYAARFLNALYAGSRDWPTAVAAYHSETPALGQAYRVLVMARWHEDAAKPLVLARGAYGDFSAADRMYGDQAYGAFAQSTRVYGAFGTH